MKEQWLGFQDGNWTQEINVNDFILKNYQKYDGTEDFLVGTTEKTKSVWERCTALLKEELEKKVLDIDTDHMAGINAFEAGYINEIGRAHV